MAEADELFLKESKVSAETKQLLPAELAEIQRVLAQAKALGFNASGDRFLFEEAEKLSNLDNKAFREIVGQAKSFNMRRYLFIVLAKRNEALSGEELGKIAIDLLPSANKDYAIMSVIPLIKNPSVADIRSLLNGIDANPQRGAAFIKLAKQNEKLSGVELGNIANDLLKGDEKDAAIFGVLPNVTNPSIADIRTLVGVLGTYSGRRSTFISLAKLNANLSGEHLARIAIDLLKGDEKDTAIFKVLSLVTKPSLADIRALLGGISYPPARRVAFFNLAKLNEKLTGEELGKIAIDLMTGAERDTAISGVLPLVKNPSVVDISTLLGGISTFPGRKTALLELAKKNGNLNGVELGKILTQFFQAGAARDDTILALLPNVKARTAEDISSLILLLNTYANRLSALKQLLPKGPKPSLSEFDLLVRLNEGEKLRLDATKFYNELK